MRASFCGSGRPSGFRRRLSSTDSADTLFQTLLTCKRTSLLGSTVSSNNIVHSERTLAQIGADQSLHLPIWNERLRRQSCAGWGQVISSVRPSKRKGTRFNAKCRLAAISLRDLT